MGNSSGLSFFQKFFGSLFSGNDPEAEKKRLLKSISKNLSHTGYKFYKVASDQILPGFGKFFYDMYKIISPAQLFFQNQQNPAFYKNMVIEYSLSEKQKQLSENFSEESIATLSKNLPFEQLKKKIKTDLGNFTGEFDSNKVSAIDSLYTKLLSFRSFCTYDFYFMLKKFDSTLRESDFSRTPHLEPIDASYIADDLKDFVSIICSMPLNEDWSDVILLFKSQRGIEPVKQNQWNKIVQKLRQLRDSRIFDMIIQLTTKDPSYATNLSPKQEHIFESYIESLQKQTLTALNKLEDAQKNSKIDSLLVQIFNTNTVSVLKNYTDSLNETFAKKNLEGYIYAKPLNYLKAFLIDYVKRDIREYADLVLIRGKWTLAPLAAEMSNQYHALLEISDSITEFDEKMAEEGEIGIKIKTLLPRTERDKEANNIIRTILGDANSMAKDYLVAAARNMIGFAKTLKSLIEDYSKPKGEILMNWKELDRYAEHPIKTLGIEVYKKLYLFVSLLQGLI